MVRERGPLDELDLVNTKFDAEIKAIDKDTPRGITQLNHVAADIFAAHDYYKEYRKMLGDDEVSHKLVQKAVVGHDFPPKGTISSELYVKLLDAAHQKELLGQHLILEQLDAGFNFGLKPFEVDVLRASCEVGVEFDEMCSLWRKDVSENPINEKARDLNLTNPYSVITGNNLPDYKQVTWVEKYPLQTTAIAERFRNLALRLSGYEDEAKAFALADYFNKFADAFDATNVTEPLSSDQLPDIWRDVDRAWMKIDGRIQPVASREYGYYDPNGIRVFPDYRLIVVENNTANELEATRGAMARTLAERYGNSISYQHTINSLTQVRVFPGSDVTFSGSLDFQAAGQSLPNEQVVQDELGTKIVLNPEVTAGRWNLAKQLAKKVFFDPKDQNDFEQIDSAIDMTVRYVGGHEFGEPLFQSTNVIKTFGEEVITLLNEDLANLCATTTIEARVRSQDLSQRDYYNHAICLLGTYLRLIDTARGAPHLQPYYIGHTLQGLRRMIDTGFIYQDGKDDWHINSARTVDLYEANQKDLDHLVQIGDELDKTQAQKYLNQAIETDQIKDIIVKINPHARFS